MNKINLIFLLLINYSIVWSEVSIDFFGNKYFSQPELLEQLGLPDGFDQLDETKQIVLLRLAAFNLGILYENEGFFTNKIEFQPGNLPSNRFSYQIIEGPKFRYASIDIINLAGSQDDLTEVVLNSKVSGYFNGEVLTQDLDEIIFQFKEQGYLHVRSYQSIELDTSSALVYVQFEVDLGPQLKMGQLFLNSKRKRIEGTSDRRGQTRQSYLRSLWGIQSNNVIEGQSWDEYRNKLLATGLYSSVQLKDSVSLINPGRHDVYVNLVERVPGQYSSRLFYEDLMGLGVSVGVKHKNIQGEMHEVSLNTTYAQNREQVTLGYGHPLFFGTGVRFDNRVTFRHDSLPDPTETEGDERFEAINKGTFSKRFNNNLRAIGLIDLRYVDKYNEPTAIVKLKFEPSIQLNFTNKLTDPTRGSRFRFAIGNGGAFKANERYNYLKIESGYYYPLGSQLFWAGAIDWGKFLTTGDPDDAKLFYQGGFRSVRGYDARSIAPSKDSTYVLNGVTEQDTLFGPSPQFLRLSNELRYNTKTFPSLQIVQFTDWAFINDLSSQYTSQKSMAMGLGARYQVSLLTFRLDYTFKKNFFRPFALETLELGRISFDLSQAI